eukprot:COSAG03_NODE_11271_length_602_cov_1.101392_2_plen_80_part_01
MRVVKVAASSVVADPAGATVPAGLTYVDALMLCAAPLRLSCCPWNAAYPRARVYRSQRCGKGDMETHAPACSAWATEHAH